MSQFWKKNQPDDPRANRQQNERLAYLTDTADWKSLFEDVSLMADCLKQAEERRSHLKEKLSRVLDTHSQLAEKQGLLLQNVIRTLDYCEGLAPRSIEIEAVRTQLQAMLGEQGVAAWSPTIGEPMPEGCEPIAERPSAEQPAQTILEVLAPGYVWGRTMLLRRPRVVISRLVEPEPAPIEVPPSQDTPLKDEKPAEAKIPDEPEKQAGPEKPGNWMRRFQEWWATLWKNPAKPSVDGTADEKSHDGE
jgi:molecular chaperone GrpE (heat shock protein)